MKSGGLLRMAGCLAAVALSGCGEGEIGSGFGIVPESEGVSPARLGLPAFALLERGSDRKAMRIETQQAGRVRMLFFEYVHTSGPARNAAPHARTQQKQKYTACFLSGISRAVPRFESMPPDLSHRMREEFGRQDIDFPGDDGFSLRHWLTGPDEEAVMMFFSQAVRDALREARGIYLEGRPEGVLLYRLGRYPNRAALAPFEAEARALAEALGR